MRYKHLIDLRVTGKGTKSHSMKGVAQADYSFEIEEVIAENENILSLLKEANGMEGINAACLHHVKQISFGQRADFRMSYLPLKKAI